MHPLSLTEWIKSKPLKIEFHDLDEILKNEIKNNLEILNVQVNFIIV